jgi:hypothetical protein
MLGSLGTGKMCWCVRECGGGDDREDEPGRGAGSRRWKRWIERVPWARLWRAQRRSAVSGAGVARGGCRRGRFGDGESRLSEGR